MDELGERGYQKCIMEDWVGALAIWDEAIKRYPKDKRCYNNRALCYLRTKEYNRALSDALFLTSHFPDYVRGYFRQGEVLAAMERYEEASKCFRHVIKLEPSCADAVKELLEIQIQLLCKKGFSRYQAGSAVQMAHDIAEAETILRSGAFPRNGGDEYFSEDEELLPASSIDPFEDPSNPKRSCSLWVGNMTENMTDAQVASLFKRFGEVKSAKLCPKNYCAFVNFVHHESASKAMRELQGCDLAGNKKVRLRWPDSVMLGK